MNTDDLQRLIQNPSERMDTELKRWMNPADPLTVEKIAKGCNALRNYNGGMMIFGFDKTGQPDPNVPANVREMFDVDKIQGIVSKYASELYAVDVEYIERGGIEYPVIVVPSGVKTPVAMRAGLENPADKSLLIKKHTVYVRSLNSSGIVSSSEAQCDDWPGIVRRCFDNREADIGGFVRRHLSSLDLSNLPGLLANCQPKPQTSKLAVDFLNIGKSRFEVAKVGKSISSTELGTFEIAVVIDGPMPEHTANQDFYRTLQINKPNHSGWSLWIGLPYVPTDGTAYIDQDGWESLTGAAPDMGGFDFWRAEPTGRFYHLRRLWDDTQNERGMPPGMNLDYSLQIMQVTEAVSIASHFARALGCDETKTIIGFACRWTGLRGRRLYAWSSNPLRGYASMPATQGEITTKTAMPLETPESAFAPVVKALVMPMLDLFVVENGRIDLESYVKEILSRKLGFTNAE